MMELQLGLIGFGLAGTGRPMDGLGQGGDDLDLEVEYRLTTLDDAKTVRQQILGYVEAGNRPVLPLVWTGDSTFDGYYRLTSASTSTDIGTYLSRRVKAKFQLERIQAYSAPAIESILSGARRAFAAGYPGTAAPWHAMPSTWTATDLQAASTVIFSPQRRQLTTTKSMLFSTGDPTFYNAAVLQSASPAAFYDGSVVIRSGPTRALQTGRQLVSDPANWEIDNGLVKITPSARTTSMFDMAIRLADGSAWNTRIRGFLVRYGYVGAVGVDWDPDSLKRVNIVKNTPEECVLCLVYANMGLPTPGLFMVRVYISLRRGSRYASVTTASSLSTLWGLACNFQWNGVTTTFANDGGAQVVGMHDAVDANNQRTVILRGSALTAFGTSQAYGTGAPFTTVDYGVGYLSGAVIADDAAAGIGSQWIAAQTETMRVVGQ